MRPENQKKRAKTVAVMVKMFEAGKSESEIVTFLKAHADAEGINAYTPGTVRKYRANWKDGKLSGLPSESSPGSDRAAHSERSDDIAAQMPAEYAAHSDQTPEADISAEHAAHSERAEPSESSDDSTPSLWAEQPERSEQSADQALSAERPEHSDHKEPELLSSEHAPDSAYMKPSADSEPGEDIAASEQSECAADTILSEPVEYSEKKRRSEQGEHSEDIHCSESLESTDDNQRSERPEHSDHITRSECAEPSARKESSELGEHSERIKPAEPSARSERMISADHSGASDHTGTARGNVIYSERSADSEHIPLTEQRVREIFKEMITELMPNIRPIPTITGADLPPEPLYLRGQGPGRRQDRRYKKVTVTIDENLWGLIVAEQRRTKTSVARVVEILLWRSLGQPRLSFEHPTEERMNA